MERDSKRFLGMQKCLKFWKCLTRIISIQLLSLHWTAPETTPCAWEHFWKTSWTLTVLVPWPFPWEHCSSTLNSVLGWIFHFITEFMILSKSPNSRLRNWSTTRTYSFNCDCENYRKVAVNTSTPYYDNTSPPQL